MNMNLAAKVMLTLTLVIAVALITAGLLIGRSTGAAYRGYLTGFQRQQLAAVAGAAGQMAADGADWITVQAWLDQQGAATGATPADEVESGGSGFRGGRGGHAGGQMGAAAITRYLVVDGTSGRPLAAPNVDPVTPEVLAGGVIVPGAPETRVVALGERTPLGRSEERLLTEVNRAILLSALVAGGLAMILGAVLVAGILRPLRALETGVDEVAQGNLTARVAARGNDEVARLAASFNAMAASLQRQEELRRRLVADIAHELRTPLTVLQGNLQAMLDGVYPLERGEIRSVYDETRLLARLVNDLHELAQAEAGNLALARQPVDAGAVAVAVVAAFRATAREREIGLETTVPDRLLLVDADPERLEQMLHNLLGNALRHTPAGGTVGIQVDAVDGWIHFLVTDSGPGIGPDALPHIFDRFYRAGDSRMRADSLTGSAGLGLAIVKALAQAHGGEVGVNSKPGQGATFRIALPQAGA